MTHAWQLNQIDAKSVSHVNQPCVGIEPQAKILALHAILTREIPRKSAWLIELNVKSHSMNNKWEFLLLYNS